MKAALWLLAAVPLWAQWTPEFSLRVKGVTSVVPSPDGRFLVYAVSAAEIGPERSESVTQIRLDDLRSHRSVHLTQGEKSSTAPTFSPDLRHVYFLSSRSGHSNVYRIGVDGGEALRLTDWSGEISLFKVSPDGRWIVFAGRPKDAAGELARKQKLDFRIIGEAPNNHSLWIVPASGGEPRQLTTATRHVASLDWSPDSRRLVYEHWESPLFDYSMQADVAEVEIADGAVKPVAATAAAEWTPFYSPDGRSIALVRSVIPARWPGEEHLAVYSRETATVRQLASTPDARPSLLGWSSSGSELYFGEMKLTRSALYSMPLSGEPRLVWEPSEGTYYAGYHPNATLARGGKYLGLSHESSSRAAEATLLALPEARILHTSAVNTSLDAPPIGRTEVIRWKSSDGQEVEGLVTFPAKYEPNRKYPLILNIHGGPSNVFAEVYLGKGGLYPLATFSSRGYVILRPNPRGSGGYGKTFRFANVSDWGGKDYQDIMAGVDHLIRSGLVDGDRMAVMGWSYGGFMTSWVIGHTNRFKAAVVGAAVTNLWSFTGTSDIPGFLPDYFQGEPWQAFARFRDHSPLSFADRVTTPTLILHGEGDERVPVSQGYEYYTALKRRGVTVQMVVYPREPHGPREPKFQLDIMRRHLEWTEKHCGPGGPL